MQKCSSQESSNYYNYENRSRLLRGYYELIEKQDFKYHLTANFNRETTHVQGWKILKNWSARVDHRLHGRNFHRKDMDNRLFFIAFPEIGGISGHLHYHMGAKVPAHSEDRFREVAIAQWERLVRTGDLYFQEIEDSPEDLGRVNSYISKEMFWSKGLEHMIISTEFAPLH